VLGVDWLDVLWPLISVVNSGLGRNIRCIGAQLQSDAGDAAVGRRQGSAVVRARGIATKKTVKQARQMSGINGVATIDDEQ